MKRYIVYYMNNDGRREIIGTFNSYGAAQRYAMKEQKNYNTGLYYCSL